MPVLDAAIVGGGAAGLATAIFAARTRPDLRVGVFDGARVLGAKILISGGGRCNVSNAQVTAADFNGGHAQAIARILRALSVADTVGFFRTMGVALHEEALGKLFPDTHRARTVLDALIGECRLCGVAIHAGCRVIGVRAGPDGFLLDTSAGDVAARRVVLATGGLSLPRTGSDGSGYAIAQRLGHTLVPTTPALVPLLLEGTLHEGLAGVSHDGRLVVAAAGVKPRRIAGRMLWTHVGVSGPAILDASRHLLRHRLQGRTAHLQASLVAPTFERADRLLLQATGERPRSSVAAVLAAHLPAAVAERIASLAHAEGLPLAELRRETRRHVAHLASSLQLPVRESRGYNHAEVTAGGIDLAEIDPRTMASRGCRGLYLVGEVLDVDGRLGGFNFQWAWASARVAGSALAASLA
jgi:predicted Rossmann fold flavoprotein